MHSTWFSEADRGLLMQGKGKIAAQCGHAVAGIFNKFRRKQPVPFQQWEMLGAAKIALKVPTSRELVRLSENGPCCFQFLIDDLQYLQWILNAVLCMCLRCSWQLQHQTAG